MFRLRLYFPVLASVFFAISSNAVPLERIAPWEASANPSNDKLRAMPEKEQAQTLSKATHYNCQAKDPYYVGTEWRGANKGVSFWSITCEHDGKKMMIIIAPDAIGSTKVVSCNLLEKYPWHCYSKLK